jgi:tetratricopeptide (TPR) repeat protein
MFKLADISRGLPREHLAPLANGCLVGAFFIRSACCAELADLQHRLPTSDRSITSLNLHQAHISLTRLDKQAGLTLLKRLTEQSSISEARSLLTTLLLRFSGDADVHLAAADLYRGIGSSGIALGEYRQVLALRPTDARASIGLAQLYLAAGDDREALHYARRVSAAEPDLEEAQLVLVSALLKSGDVREADTILSKILVAHGGIRVKQANIAYLAYQLYRTRKEYASALTYLDRAIELEPRQYQWLSDKADTCELIREYDKAKSALEKLRSVDPYSIEALSKLGGLLEFRLNDIDGALKVYQDLIQIDPAYVPALTGIDRCCAKKNDIARQLKLTFWRNWEELFQPLAPRHTDRR